LEKNRQNNRIKAVFLDRDGTINIDKKGYVHDPDDFELYPFSAQAINIINKLDYLVFVVTNQSGIARAYYTLEDLKAIHLKMNKSLREAGARIDEIFFSPYHKEGSVEPFDIDHEDRKPGLGLFKKAFQKYHFEIKKSYMIGDKYTDIEFGKRAGLKTILLLTGDGENEFLNNRNNWIYKPDFIVKNLLAAAKLISKFGE
jgi:D,D-heptose 1,7-bisphosphate phosphatase